MSSSSNSMQPSQPAVIVEASSGSIDTFSPIGPLPLLFVKIVLIGIPLLLFCATVQRKTTRLKLASVPPFRWLVQRIDAWQYLLWGPSIIQRKFDTAKGEPFEVLAPDTRYVFVSSEKHINELDTAPDTVLSLQAASKQMLQPVYTMHGFNWFDRRGTEGVGFIRALRTLLTNNLPCILPEVGYLVRRRFSKLHSESPIQNGSRVSAIYPMIVNIVVLANAVSFFGKDIAKNESFMVSALAYIEETLICAEIVRLTPKFLSPLIGGIIARRLHSHEIIFDTLLQIAEERCQERDLKNRGHRVPKHDDCIQWIMETSPQKNPWTAKRVVHEVMAIWFGSVHALSTTITFAIHDLSLHPEYVEPLRNELSTSYEAFERTGDGLPLLDSFIKESARLTPVESMSTRRSALKPFIISDGTKLAPGDWACTPVRAIMQNADLYPSPLDFQGFRFVNKEILEQLDIDAKVTQSKPSSLTTIDKTWHVWGTGRMACPGRFYAAAVMKVIVSQMLLNYDCELVEKDSSRWFTWRSSMLPKPSTAVILKHRTEEK
ncbi:cytochrome P450 [Annulohypoxylon bovei var. microspora]|nr:cytochrome P450 [Annulohypoxylon bovei var. microspora]